MNKSCGVICSSKLVLNHLVETTKHVQASVCVRWCSPPAAINNLSCFLNVTRSQDCNVIEQHLPSPFHWRLQTQADALEGFENNN